MSRFLITTMPATGHVMPMLPLARELSARGHELHWYAGAEYRDRVLSVGASHHPIRSSVYTGAPKDLVRWQRA